MNADPLAQLLADIEKAWWDGLDEVLESQVGTPRERLARIPTAAEFYAERLRAHRDELLAALGGVECVIGSGYVSPRRPVWVFGEDAS